MVVEMESVDGICRENEKSSQRPIGKQAASSTQRGGNGTASLSSERAALKMFFIA